MLHKIWSFIKGCWTSQIGFVVKAFHLAHRALQAYSFIWAVAIVADIQIYHLCKSGFQSVIDKITQLRAAAPAIVSPGDHLGAVSLIDKIQVANAIFPIDELLQCISFIFLAWVLSLQLKFAFFVIRMLKR